MYKPNEIVILALGGILISLIVFSLLSGLKIIKLSPKSHKISGVLILIFALIHALLAIISVRGD